MNDAKIFEHELTELVANNLGLGGNLLAVLMKVAGKTVAAMCHGKADEARIMTKNAVALFAAAAAEQTDIIHRELGSF